MIASVEEDHMERLGASNQAKNVTMEMQRRCNSDSGRTYLCNVTVATQKARALRHVTAQSAGASKQLLKIGNVSKTNKIYLSRCVSYCQMRFLISQVRVLILLDAVPHVFKCVSLVFQMRFLFVQMCFLIFTCVSLFCRCVSFFFGMRFLVFLIRFLFLDAFPSFLDRFLAVVEGRRRFYMNEMLLINLGGFYIETFRCL